jgi:MoaA/NifB/PqqE/SkfB family radical SAM enzyme
MYFQITNRCNMTCDHCGFNCTKEGIDMTAKIYKQSIKFAYDMGLEDVSIGGGEPTLHKQFWNILGLCLSHFDYTWMATNGSNTETAIALSKLAQKGIMGVALSIDAYHDLIDEKVIKAFNKLKYTHNSNGYLIDNKSDYREIRTVNNLIDSGRAKENGISTTKNDCICPDLFIKPDGKVYLCGCLDSPCIGDVFNGITKEWKEKGYWNYECIKMYRENEE